jgi:DNA polymerase III delta prime subunit
MENILLAHILKQPFQTLVLVGETQDVFLATKSFFKETENIDLESHGDVAIHAIDSLTIDIAREIKEWTEGMPQYRPNKLLVLTPTIFPVISQNALLKTFEEPSGNTQIILVVKDISVLLPTILSRAVVYHLPVQEKTHDDSLLRLAPHARLLDKEIAMLLKTGLQKPTKERVGEFFNTLTQAVLQSSYSPAERREAVQVLTTVTPYIYDQGASIKMLVEYTCLQLPILDKDK